MLLVAVANDDDNKVLGYCGATYAPSHRAAQLDSLGVDEAHRRQGIASALLKEVERRLYERQVTQIDVVLRAPHASRLQGKPGADDGRGDGYAEYAAASFLQSFNYQPVQRVEPSSTDADAFELVRRCADVVLKLTHTKRSGASL